MLPVLPTVVASGIGTAFTVNTVFFPFVVVYAWPVVETTSPGK
jgi:hypothetical protein